MVGIGYYGTRLKMTFGYACLRRERSLTSRCDLFLCSFRGWAFRANCDGTRGCAVVINGGLNLLLLPKYKVDVLCTYVDTYMHTMKYSPICFRIKGFNDLLLV